MRSGNKKEILNFIKTKNILDRNIFQPESILWMLKDKDFYYEVVSVLRERKFFNRHIWGFAFLHGDMESIREMVRMDSNNQLNAEMFEYFPYYSTRTHQFANETKSTIRNVQFKETYIKFLVSSVVSINEPSSFAVSFAYCLILQDRLREAEELVRSIVAKYPGKH